MSDEEFAFLLMDSHERLVGRPLLDEPACGRPTAAWLFEDATFCLLAHDAAPDPRFIYANAAAQACFGYEPGEFIGLPSRLSAEAALRDERQRMMDVVAQNGFVDDVNGVRVTKSGRRFRIEAGIVWELIDRAGLRHGQAAMFHRWCPLD